MSVSCNFGGKTFTYNCNVEEKYGAFPVVVDGVAYPVMVAEMKCKKLLLDPANPRLWDKSDKSFDYTKNGQANLMNALATDEFETATKSLQNAMEANGGQNEAIWVHCLKGQPTVVEGNRRLTVAKELGWTTMVVNIFPDQMPPNAVLDMVTQRHVSGMLHWPSAVRSEVAYRYLVERKMTMEEIATKLQFKSKNEAERYIHSYVWLKESGLPSSEWSKMNHAYRPVLVKYFGYDKDHWKDNSAPFKEELRTSHYKDQASVKIIDELVDRAASQAKCPVPINHGFPWFVQLIKDEKVTDCRHCDGIVSPAIIHADTEYGLEVLKILQSKSRNVTKGKTDGEGSFDHDVPAQMAWNFLKQSRGQSALVSRVDDLMKEIKIVLKSPHKLSEYQSSTSDNQVLTSEVTTLIALLSSLQEKMDVAPKGRSSKKASDVALPSQRQDRRPSAL